MSAWIVSKAHIDALVDAAMSVRHNSHDSGLNWWDEANPDFEAILQAEGYDAYSQIIQRKRREISYSDSQRASEVGMMLWAENVASIHARYPDTAETDSNYPGPCDFEGEVTIASYQFKATRSLSPAEILKAISCYEYQSCEHDGWRNSEAKSFCEALQAKMISLLDGYDDAKWGLEEENVRGFARV